MEIKNQIRPECITSTQANIIFNSRLYWRELIYWSRALYASVFLGIGTAQDVFARLYSVPTGYAYTLRFILQRHITEEYEGRFHQYIIALRGLVRAVMDGDMAAVNQQVNELYKNAGQIAEFLSEVFPSLNQDVLEEMIKTLAQYQIEEINAYITGNYKDLVETYDRLVIHADKTADYISAGIIDFITAAPRSPGNARNNQSQEICITGDEFNLILEIALFWVDFATWFRSYRISVMAGIGSQKELYDRLIRLTVDFGDAMKNFIDPVTVDVQMGLLREYIDLMDQLLRLRMSGDIEEMNRVYKLSIDNINKRAEFLGSAFPSADAAEWRNYLIRLHTDLIEMGGEFLSGNFPQTIRIFNNLINRAEDMGFFLVEALLREGLLPQNG